MKESLCNLVNLCMSMNTAEDARRCLEMFRPIKLQLDEYYSSIEDPDYRISKMLCNMQYYVECWLNEIEYSRDWSRHLIEGIGITLKKTAEYDFEIRYFKERRNERFQKQFKLYEQLKKQEKAPIEEGLDLPYDMSIFMATYNQLELTKLCLESIFQNTNDVSCEIFLIDNGSTDGTYEYFKNDSRIKLIRLVENITLLPALQVFYESHLDKGRFWMYMNNDVVVTPRWASLMLDCIKSDPRIAMVVPVTNRTDPTLSIKPPLGLYEIQQIQTFGEENNRKTNIWKECVVVWPYVGLIRPSLKRLLGHYEDYLYYKFYYADGDFLFAGRLSGYTFMQCTNVYVHHFDGGASTMNRRRVMLDVGESQFYEKFGYFPSDAVSKLPFENILDWSRPNAKILFIGLARGNFASGIYYYCKKFGLDKVRFYCVDTMEKLKLNNIWEFAEFEKIDNIYELDKAFQGETFDRIIFGGNLFSVRHADRLLSIIHSRLTMNGNLIFAYENNSSLPVFENALCTSRISERDRVRLRKNSMLDINQLSISLYKSGFSIRSIHNYMLDEALSLSKLDKIKEYESLVQTDCERVKLKLNMNRLSTLIVAGKQDEVDTEHTMEQLLYRQKQEKNNEL